MGRSQSGLEVVLEERRVGCCKEVDMNWDWCKGGYREVGRGAIRIGLAGLCLTRIGRKQRRIRLSAGTTDRTTDR